MSQPGKWWWGLGAAALLWIAAAVASTGTIEDDLQSRAKTAAPWAQTFVIGRDAVVDGLAPSAEAKVQSVAAIASLTGVRRADEGSITILAEAKPYRFEAVRDGGALTIKGFFPDEATHAAILDAAGKSLPGTKVKDELVLARGMPDGYLAAASFGLSQLTSLTSGSVNLQDQAYSISGVALNPASFNAETARAKVPPAGFKTVSISISPPVQKPFTWSAVKEGSTITLSGYVPSNEVRARNIEAVKAALPNASIVDKQFLAAGEPKGFEAMASYAVAQLAKLAKGMIALEDARYSISGEASDAATLDASLSATKTLPVGFSLGAVALMPPVQVPYIWAARRDGGGVTLEGFAPSLDVRARIVAAAKALFQGAAINDRLAVAAGEPTGFEDAINFALQQLAKLSSGSVSLKDAAYTIAGETADAATTDAVIAKARELPKGFSLASAAVVGPKVTASQIVAPQIVTPQSVAPPEPAKLPQPAVTTPAPALPPSNPAQVATCRKEFTDELNDSEIYFDTGKDSFRQVSFAVLDRLIEIARKCPDVNVEIAAHTDSDGDATANQQLSERRALAVLSYLKTRIDVSRYRAAGYGDTRPVASNATSEGKQKNRRVEFDVK